MEEYSAMVEQEKWEVAVIGLSVPKGIDEKNGNHGTITGGTR